MNTKKFSEAMNELDNKYVEKAINYQAKKRNPVWVKWSAAIAACLCFVVMGCFLYTYMSMDFNTFVSRYNTALNVTNVSIGDKVAWYKEVSVKGNKLEKYIGEQYADESSRVWFVPTDTNNLKYLICKNAEGELSLWKFSYFDVDDGNYYTYDDVLTLVYGVNSVDDIASITTSPFKANNTDFGKSIQKEIGTHEYADRADIETFYNIATSIICYGANGESKADENRFAYSFSTDSESKLDSGESTYGTRVITITLANGTTVDGWIYSALSGSFFEYGGIFTEPLADEAVYELNEIFGIK